jgi:DNA-binding cell septation regulator SpoVG
MEITRIKIIPLKEKKQAYYKRTNDLLIAFASIVFDDVIILHGIKMIEGENKQLIIEMPKHKMKNGMVKDVYHFLNSEFRKQIKQQLFDFYYKNVA